MSAHTEDSTLSAQHGHADSSTKTIWKTFWILLGITMLELAIAIVHLKFDVPSVLIRNSIYLCLTVLKAFFIVAEFMHLKHEVKNLILTILIPLLLFIWFIIAFLADGDSWKNMRKDLAPGKPQTEQVAQPKGE
ncbi:hypothetical protein DCC81_04535 [Chitinophaga parva]|uniref:Cytochrome C oxidase subunit IV n=1 Tax=Chitinophaga parva TaxID=2169414 RepID=A0A2T7BM52_9BACT|nr:cytochrome C oxidase subunit IV family protein [Chitinophaga parva]PUZ28758.1 hypothetical protein DCC81_04535 [Chitinophaga parva]